ncbi:MAG: type IX secretion system membrane protein PorP/SprF, partial [Bacteroidetes bacterium]|nr:type IX secretion system membrane protein PorP/SprF [Bacteroidota bacterium]
IGALYNTKDYFVGISTLHLPQTQFDWYGSTANIPGNGFVNRVGRHVYINGGYNLPLAGNQDLVLQPRTLLKFDRAKFQWDLGSLIEINQKYWGGLNIRGGEGIMFLAGFKSINNKGEGFKIGLSYDLTLSQIQSISNGTIELMGNYCFPVNIKPDEPDPDLLPRFLGGYSR